MLGDSRPRTYCGHTHIKQAQKQLRTHTPARTPTQIYSKTPAHPTNSLNPPHTHPTGYLAGGRRECIDPIRPTRWLGCHGQAPSSGLKLTERKDSRSVPELIWEYRTRKITLKYLFPDLNSNFSKSVELRKKMNTNYFPITILLCLACKACTVWIYCWKMVKIFFKFLRKLTILTWVLKDPTSTLPSQFIQYFMQSAIPFVIPNSLPLQQFAFFIQYEFGLSIVLLFECIGQPFFLGR